MKSSSFFLILFVLSSCCGDILTYNTTKINAVEIISEDSLSIGNYYSFDLEPRDSILSTRTNDNNCGSEEIKIEPIHFIKNIQVYTQTDFSQNFPSNSLINDLINVQFYNSNSHNIEDKSLAEWLEYINSGNDNTWKMAEFYNASKFYFIENPYPIEDQNLKFIFTLSDDNVLQTFSPTITWN